MPSKKVLEFRNVSKSYPIYTNEWWRIAHFLGLASARQRCTPRETLKNISFTLHQGESLAIIGRNGAGKSTLLKLLAGVSTPTQGDIWIDGRLSAILELGLGFNPEFSAKENISYIGTLLGYSAPMLQESLPWIERFADIGSYFNAPFRTYSSGMQARLAFALATASRPDILIVDEALSISDIQFQHKCFQRIKELREQGTTLLFVSHDPVATLALCERAVLLDQGEILQDGATQVILDAYNDMIATKEEHQVPS